MPESNATAPHQGMAGLFPMPPLELLTYQDLVPKLKLELRTVMRRLKGCKRYQPSKRTVRFLEADVLSFMERRWARGLQASSDNQAGQKPGRKTGRG